MVLFRSALLAAFAAVIAFSVAGAAGPVRVEIGSLQEQQGRITATINAIGPDGKALLNLQSGSVKATLDGQPLNVSSLQAASAATNSLGVVLLVDVSGSMAGDPLNQARSAITDFVRSLNPGDAVSLYSFDAKVHLLQDFTVDRNLVAQALGKLQAGGDTALYDAVSEASRKVGSSSYPRKLIVVLSDGDSTSGQTTRPASIDAARQSGAPVVTVGLGAEIDRSYLTDLADASGGRILVAQGPSALRSTYSDLATSLKAQYTVSIAVPDSIDRSVPGQLSIQVISGTDTGSIDRQLPPRPGAKAPTFKLTVDGLAGNQKLTSTTTVTPALPADLTVTRVEIFIDGASAGVSTQPPFSFPIDPGTLSAGNHVIKAVATDDRGRQGEWQTAFATEAANGGGGGSSLPIMPVVAIVAVLGLGYASFKKLHKKRPAHYEDRIKPWRGRVNDPGEAAPEFQRIERLSPPPPQENVVVGRVIVMDVKAVRGGDLSAIHEFEISSSPLTIGTSPTCDIVLTDPQGRIAGEEARVWVQKGRLVYHKLTTLSAMATEGVTSGWMFLDPGDEMQLGPYGISFQPDFDREEEIEPEPAEPARLGELWPRIPEDSLPMPSSQEYQADYRSLG